MVLCLFASIIFGLIIQSTIIKDYLVYSNIKTSQFIMVNILTF